MIYKDPRRDFDGLAGRSKWNEAVFEFLHKELTCKHKELTCKHNH